MNPFITFREVDANGNLGYYILQREFPHYIGVVSINPIQSFIQPSPIYGYNMWVAFSGTIRGAFVPSYKNVTDEIVIVLDKMANWYLQQRILPEQKKYKKYKINDTVTGK